MKVTIDQTTLHKVMGAVGQAVQSRPVAPEYGGVLIDATGDEMIARTTDGHTMRILYRAPAIVERPGSALLDAATMAGLARVFPASPVNIATTKRRATIRCDEHEIGLAALDATAFPVNEDEESEGEVVYVSSALLREALQQVQFAAARDAMRPVLTAINIAIGCGEMRMAATDGMRLAVYSIAIDNETESMRSVNLPASAAAKLVRLLGDADDDGDVAIGITTDTRMHFNLGHAVMSVQLVAGDYPAYAGLVPESYSSRIKVAAAEFRNAVAIADQLVGHNDWPALQFTVSDSEYGGATQMLQLASKAANGESGESVMVAEVEGAPCAVTLNSRFVMDALAVMSDDARIVFDVTSEGAPCKLTQDGDGAAAHVIMPMMTNG